MSLFKPICRAAAPAEIPTSAKIAYLALNLALWDRLGLIKKILMLFPDPAEALRIPVHSFFDCIGDERGQDGTSSRKNAQ